MIDDYYGRLQWVSSTLAYLFIWCSSLDAKWRVEEKSCEQKKGKDRQNVPWRECKIFEHLGKTGVCSDIHVLGHTKVARRGDLTGIREKKNSKDLGCLLRVSISNCIKVHKTIMHFTVIKDVWPYTVSTSCDYYSHFVIMQKECKGANIILWFISFILRCRQGAEEWHVLLRDAIYCRVKTLNLD